MRARCTSSTANRAGPVRRRPGPSLVPSASPPRTGPRHTRHQIKWKSNAQSSFCPWLSYDGKRQGGARRARDELMKGAHRRPMTRMKARAARRQCTVTCTPTDGPPLKGGAARTQRHTRAQTEPSRSKETNAALRRAWHTIDQIQTTLLTLALQSTGDDTDDQKRQTGTFIRYCKRRSAKIQKGPLSVALLCSLLHSLQTYDKPKYAYSTHFVSLASSCCSSCAERPFTARRAGHAAARTGVGWVGGRGRTDAFREQAQSAACHCRPSQIKSVRAICDFPPHERPRSPRRPSHSNAQGTQVQQGSKEEGGPHAGAGYWVRDQSCRVVAVRASRREQPPVQSLMRCQGQMRIHPSIRSRSTKRVSSVLLCGRVCQAE